MDTLENDTPGVGDSGPGQHRLIEAAERVQLALDAGAILGTWVWHVPSDRLRGDSRFARSFGLDPERCQAGLPLDEACAAIHPDDQPRVQAAISAALARGGAYRCEYRVPDGAAGYRWIEANGRCDLSSAGEPLRFPGVLVDIDRRKRAEDGLQRAAESFRHLVQENPFGIYVVDADFRLAQVSRGARDVFRGVEPLLGRDFSEVMRAIWTEPWATTAIALFRHTLATGEPYVQPRTVETRADRGAVEAYDWCIERADLPDGRPGVVCYFYDLTARQRWEAQLATSEQRFRTAVAAMRGVVWTNDATGRMAGEQSGWAAFTGQSPAQYADFGWAASVHPEDVVHTLAAWETAVATGTRFAVEHRVRRYDGVFRRFAVRALPIRDPDGHIVEWVGVHTDVTDIHDAQETIERQNDALRDAARQKDRFLATLSHELRNPLAPIRNAAALLERGRLAPEEVAWASDVVARQSRHMALLLDDLLDIARITQGKLALRREPVDLARVVNSAVEVAQPLMDARHQVLSLQLPEVSPAFEADPLRLSQMLSNLLTNAAKYSERGGRVVLAAQARDGQLELSVSDSGVGLDADELLHVFDMFAQVGDDPQRSQGGLGIGLAIVRGLAELHGGSVDAASEGPGRGATFRIRLPLSAAVAGVGARAPGSELEPALLPEP